MTIEEFINYIECIGFERSSISYIFRYKHSEIDFNNTHYNYYNGDEWLTYIPLNDSTPLRKFERRYKLKKLLG